MEFTIIVLVICFANLLMSIIQRNYHSTGGWIVVILGWLSIAITEYKG